MPRKAKEQEVVEPVKRGRGRPKGSKNKVVAKAVTQTVREVDPALEDVDPSEAELWGVEENETPRQSSEDKLAKAVDALNNTAEAMRANTIVKVPLSKFKTRSPFNPTGRKGRKLSRRVYQNGFPVLVTRLHDNEIELLEQVTPGNYLNNTVAIRESKNGASIDLHIVYKNKTIDQRMSKSWHGFSDLLGKCVREAMAEGRAR